MTESHDHHPQIFHDLPRDPPTHVILCSVCQKIDFASACGLMCPHCTNNEGVTELREPAVAFNVGSLSRLEQSQTCPGCYLILFCVKAFYHDDLPPRTSEVKLKSIPEGYVALGTSPDGAISYSTVQVMVCTHGLPGGSTEKEDELVGMIKASLQDKETSEAPARDCRLFATSSSGHEGELVPRDVSQFADSNLMRRWLDNCKERHSHTCGKRLSTATPSAMIRLIDTEELKLVKGNLQMEYTALSYVWGRAEPLLTKLVEEELSQPGGLHLEELPRTLSDAIILTRKLGRRYIWIDSACIIQDDEFDKGQQLGLMDCVYNFAEVVLIPASSTCAHTGIPGIEDPRKAWRRPNVCIRGYMYTAQLPHLSTRLESSPWRTRGWTFQEGFLARRTLIFDESQAHWNCRMMSHCENVFSEYINIHPGAGPYNAFSGFHEPRTCRVDGMTNLMSPDDCHELDYTRKVEDITSRRFSDQGDILWAFSGILKYLKPRFPKGFIWGIPWNCIDAMLLWHVDCTFRARSATHSVPTRRQRFRRLQFPSWTWSAKGCNVHYLSCGQDLVSKLTWHGSIAHPGEQGTYDEGTMELRGSRSDQTMGSINTEHFETDVSNDVCEFGVLQFDAPVARLELVEMRKLPSPEGCRHHQTTGEALIRSPNGKIIGSVQASWQFLDEKFSLELHGISSAEATTSSPRKNCKADFIHLSTFQSRDCERRVPGFREDGRTPGKRPDDWHAPGCQFADNVNLMLIDWDREHKIAYRVALTSVKESAWEKVQTQTRRIVLG